MKIVVLDRDSIGLDSPLEGLYAFGEVVVYNKTTPDEVLERIADADCVILNKVKMTAEVIASAKTLKLICIFATGYDNVDINAARECGVGVTNVPGYSTDSVALFTVANVLALYTHLKEYNDYVTSGEYSASGIPNKLVPVYHEISGKTWGIIGCGNIGGQVAKVAEAFGCRVIASRRSGGATVEEVCRESDIITIHTPLNDSTRGLVSREMIALMKKDVIIANAARGAVTDERAIADAVKEGRIGAFGSDVFSVEPFGEDHPFYEIKDLPNVCLTPHMAWGAYEARVRCLSEIVENIKAYQNGETRSRVDLL